MSGDDLYLAEIVAELGALGVGDPELRFRQMTAIVLRPECIVQRKCGLALRLLREEGFEPLAAASFAYNRNIVRELWRWTPALRPTSEFCALMDLYCLGGEGLYVLLRDHGDTGASASERLFAFKGPSRVSDRQPQHLRARVDDLHLRPLGFVHAADETRGFLRELGVFLSASRRRAIVRALVAGTSVGEPVAEAVERLYARVPELDLGRGAGPVGGAGTAELWRRILTAAAAVDGELSPGV